MKPLVALCCVIFLISCDLFKIQEKQRSDNEILAIVNTEKFFKKDLTILLPQNINKIDSQLLVKSYIQDWAVKKLLLEKAENNSSLETVIQIDDLVKDYKESLLINNYKEQLVKQKLDTVVTEEELEEYYFLNKENFKLNEELVKIKFLCVNNTINDKKEILRLFKSDDILDLEFKQESNGNSGVFFRSTIDGIIIKGWQVEVAPAGHPLDKTGGIYESYGRGWLIKPDSKYDSVVKDNEWNKMRIKVFNDQVTTWVNGTQMINLKDSIISKGKGGIALQIHDGGGIKVKWKNIKIHEFKKPDIDINF